MKSAGHSWAEQYGSSAKVRAQVWPLLLTSAPSPAPSGPSDGRSVIRSQLPAVVMRRIVSPRTRTTGAAMGPPVKVIDPCRSPSRTTIAFYTDIPGFDLTGRYPD